MKHTIPLRGKVYRIETWYEFPPIPMRDFDYGAHLEDYSGPPDPIGWGRTEEKAIADLILTLEMESDSDA